MKHPVRTLALVAGFCLSLGYALIFHVGLFLGLQLERVTSDNLPRYEFAYDLLGRGFSILGMVALAAAIWIHVEAQRRRKFIEDRFLVRPAQKSR